MKLISIGCSFSNKGERMKIVTSGCSFSGHTTHPLIEEESWSYQLSKRLNLSVQDTYHLGLGGCSLDYIYRGILHAVIDNLGQDLLVVVGWTSVQRWEHFANKSGNCQAITSNPSFPNFGKVADRYHYSAQAFWKSTLDQDKSYKQHMMNHTLFQDHMRKLNMIIGLAGFLDSHNIKYIFFNAFDPLDGWKKGTGYYGKSETGPDCPVLNKLTDYVRENVNFLEQTQIEIGAKEGYEEKIRNGDYDGDETTNPYTKKEYFSHDGWHPSVVGHTEWAKILHRELNKRWEL